MPETRLLLQHCEDSALRTLAGYKSHGGYATLEKAYREMALGGYVADMIASLGMLDPILGGVDR